MELWSLHICGGRGIGEGRGEEVEGGQRREELVNQLFVLNGKDVLVNVYQNVNYFVLLQSKRRSNKDIIIGINVLFLLYKVQTFRRQVQSK